MSWAALISSIIALAKLILVQATQKRLEQTGQNGQDIGRVIALKQVLDEAVTLLSDAQYARRQFRDQLRAYPDRLSDDDGHKRPKPTGATDAS